VLIRWMIVRDLTEVLKIEQDSSSDPWSEDEFTDALRSKSVVGIVAEDNRKIVGYAMYIKLDECLVLISFAVAASRRRQGIGTALFRWIVAKLPVERCDEIEARVPESDLAAQLFFKKMQMTAMQVVRSPVEHTDDDFYVFSYVHRPEE